MSAADDEDADIGMGLFSLAGVPAGGLRVNDQGQSINGGSGGAETGSPAPWWAVPLTYSLTRAIDSEFPTGIKFSDPAASQVGVDANGRLYVRGAAVPTKQQAQVASIISNPLVLIAGAALLYFALK